MTHLTPEEAEAVVKLRKRGDKNADLAVYWASRYQPNVAKACMEDCDASRLAADAIEQRAALAGQVVGLREALEHSALKAMLWWVLDHGSEAAQVNARDFIAAYDTALALSFPQAAQQVEEWKRSHELLGKFFEMAMRSAKEAAAKEARDE